MTNEKILTVIVPSYNMEAYLPKCLGSLVCPQELMERLEVLVVNDGSKDRTSTIAHEFELKYSVSFKVIDKTNGNYGSCINAALAAAMGRYVKVLDADDTYDPKEFEKLLSALLKCDADVVITPFDFVTPENVVGRHVTYEFPCCETFDVDTVVEKHGPVEMHALTYRTELLRKIGYRQTEGVSYTDTEWFFSPMAFAENVVYFPYVVYRYLIGREGQTVSPEAHARGIGMHLRVLRNMCDLYGRLSSQRAKCNYRYLDKCLVRYAWFVADLILRSCPDECLDENIDALFSSLAPVPHVTLELSAKRYSRLLPMRYLAYIRRGGSCRSLMLRLISFYVMIGGGQR